MNRSRLVAVLELAGPIASAVTALAPDLGTTAYELRLALGPGFPAVVLATPDPARAATALAAIRGRGHRATEIEFSDVVPSSRMIPLRDFRFEPTDLVANAGEDDRVPYADLSAILRASHRADVVTTHEVKERKLALGKAIATGGLVMTKTTTREITSKTENREQVLYLFRASGATPLILREMSAHYAGLGADLGRTALENFGKTIQRLRALAPHAAYDERLLVPRSIHGVADGVEATDLVAHLLAADLARDMKRA